MASASFQAELASHLRSRASAAIGAKAGGAAWAARGRERDLLLGRSSIGAAVGGNNQCDCRVAPEERVELCAARRGGPRA
eukprot:6241163-Pyramimonas_sp.AAC.1